MALFLEGDSLEKPIPSPTQLTPRGRELKRRRRAGRKFREAGHHPGPTSREVQEDPGEASTTKQKPHPGLGLWSTLPASPTCAASLEKSKQVGASISYQSGEMAKPVVPTDEAKTGLTWALNITVLISQPV